MTIQNFIDKLQKLDDKTKEACVHVVTPTGEKHSPVIRIIREDMFDVNSEVFEVLLYQNDY